MRRGGVRGHALPGSPAGAESWMQWSWKLGLGALLAVQTASVGFAASFSEVKLIASDAAEGDRLGYSIAVAGNTLVVGSVNADNAAGSGWIVTVPYSAAVGSFSSDETYWRLSSLQASGRLIQAVNGTSTQYNAAGQTMPELNGYIGVDLTDLIAVGKRVMQQGWVRVYGSGWVNSGIGNVPRFQITEDTKYRFDWQTQYLLETSLISTPGGSGSIELVPLGASDGAGGYWYDVGTEVQVTALAPAGSRFVGWSGDVELDESLPQNLVTMNGPRAVQAAVESDLGSQEIELLSLTHDGQLIWSNVAVGGYATVEWASTVTGNWQSSWENLVSIPSTGGVMSARVPLFYRVTWSSNLVDTGSANQNDFIGTCANTSSVTPDSVSMPATSRETSVNAE